MAWLCAACSSIHTQTPEGDAVLMDEDQFAAYVEHVFRHHNQVVNQSLFLGPGEWVSPEDVVTKAETKMDQACQPLNDLASASASGLSPSLWIKMKLAQAVPECEAATRNVERLFPSVKQTNATQ